MAALTKIGLISQFPHMDSCKALHFSSHENCFMNILLLFKQSALACSRYYVPIYILQLAYLGYKKLDRKRARQLLVDYLRSTAYGGCFLLVINATVCFMGYIFDKINFFTLAMACLLTGTTIFVESKRNRNLNAYLLSAIAIENFIHELTADKILRPTPLRDTLRFMLVSGLVMYCLAQKPLNALNFWFYDVTPASDEEIAQDKCSHAAVGDCRAQLWPGFRKYFVFGYTWSLVKMLLKKGASMVREPSRIPRHLIESAHFKFGAVLGIYAVIYRYVTCNLLLIDRAKGRKRRGLHAWLAGMLAGCTYAIAPNLQFGLTALITLLQVFYERIKENTLDAETWSKVPAAEISFMIAVPYIIVCYLTNAKELKKTNGNFILNTFSGNTAIKFKTAVWKALNLSLN